MLEKIPEETLSGAAMSDELQHKCRDELEEAIRLTLQALEICDRLSLAHAAIDLCGASEKLKALRSSRH